MANRPTQAAVSQGEDEAPHHVAFTANASVQKVSFRTDRLMALMRPHERLARPPAMADQSYGEAVDVDQVTGIDQGADLLRGGAADDSEGPDLRRIAKGCVGHDDDAMSQRGELFGQQLAHSLQSTYPRMEGPRVQQHGEGSLRHAEALATASEPSSIEATLRTNTGNEKSFSTSCRARSAACAVLKGSTRRSRMQRTRASRSP